MSASGTRAEALQAEIDTLRGKITAASDKITIIGEKIITIGNDIQRFYGKEEEEGRVKLLEAQLAEAKAQQAEAKVQQAKLENQQAEAKAELAKLESAQSNPPADEGNPTLPHCIYAVLGNNAPIGVAFFVSPTRALTALHNLIPISTTDPLDNNAVFQLASSLEVTLKRDDGSTLKVKVIRCDKTYDYALLEPAAPVEHFLKVGPVPPAHGLRECFLLTWDIALAQEREIAPGFAVHRAMVSRLSRHHIAYDANTFDGDCGGALILKRDFTVIGMHQETVNRARELKRLNQDIGDRLEDVEESVESLIRGLSSGALGLRLDAFRFD